MKISEAIGICESWFAYIERQKQRSIEMQKLATMARNGQQEEAQRRMRQIDRSVTVYDGATLEPAVRALVKMARESTSICTGCGNEIDPDTCGCGDPIKGHSYSSGHAAVPMGCDCMRSDSAAGDL